LKRHHKGCGPYQWTHSFGSLPYLPSLYPQYDSIDRPHFLRIFGSLCGEYGEITIRAIHAKTIGTKGSEMFTTSDKNNVFSGVREPAPEIAAHASSSKDRDPHKIPRFKNRLKYWFVGCRTPR
jgi:hypothetical protein